MHVDDNASAKRNNLRENTHAEKRSRHCAGLEVKHCIICRHLRGMATDCKLRNWCTAPVARNNAVRRQGEREEFGTCHSKLNEHVSQQTHGRWNSFCGRKVRPSAQFARRHDPIEYERQLLVAGLRNSQLRRQQEEHDTVQQQKSANLETIPYQQSNEAYRRRSWAEQLERCIKVWWLSFIYRLTRYPNLIHCRPIFKCITQHQYRQCAVSEAGATDEAWRSNTMLIDVTQTGFWTPINMHKFTRNSLRPVSVR